MEAGMLAIFYDEDDWLYLYLLLGGCLVCSYALGSTGLDVTGGACGLIGCNAMNLRYLASSSSSYRLACRVWYAHLQPGTARCMSRLALCMRPALEVGALCCRYEDTGPGDSDVLTSQLMASYWMPWSLSTLSIRLFVC